MSMMCDARARDLDHAARRALDRLRREGLLGEALAAEATAEVAAIWAHLPEDAIATAVSRCLASPALPAEDGAERSVPRRPDRARS